VYINGIGVLHSGGRGIKKFRETLEAGWTAPSSDDGGNRTYQVPADALKDKVLLKKLRRADKLSKMSVLAATDALTDGGIADIGSKRVGIILSTAYGPHVTTFKFLGDILDYGEAGVSPITFSNSVHNAATSYIAEALQIVGPSLTVTTFYHSFYQAMIMARLWLADGRADYLLVGGVDQYGEVLDYIYNSKLTRSTDGKIRPFGFSPTSHLPGESATFFLVGNSKGEESYCCVEDIIFDWDSREQRKPDISIIDADGLMLDESVYLSCLESDVPVAAYSSIFGSSMTGSALNCVAGALMLKNQKVYPTPVADNRHNMNILDNSYGGKIELISSVRYNCSNKGAGLYLERC